jgi:arginine-tRNA-protein transferase
MMASILLDPKTIPDSELYQNLLVSGFRRSGNYLYRPDCPSCQACEASRIRVMDFNWTRSWRRVMKRNADLRISWEPGAISDASYDLYARYIEAQHHDGDMYPPQRSTLESMVAAAWANPFLLKAYAGNDLVAVAVTDKLPSSLSAVYSFYDPSMRERSLGTFLILQQVLMARQFGARHLYLGYLIRDCRKMSYKGRFRPLETLNGMGFWKISHPERASFAK